MVVSNCTPRSKELFLVFIPSFKHESDFHKIPLLPQMIEKVPGSEIHSKNDIGHFCVAFSCTTIGLFMSPAILRSILKVLTLFFL